jgi:Putative Actinobacterial Holin-X, holin superfamily III
LPANGNKNGHKPDNLATVMTEVSERVTVLVKEELELAKAEVQQKISSLSKGLIAGGIGLVLALLFVPFALLTLAWGLNVLLGSLWLGFLIVMGVLLISMAAAFWIAWRKIKVGAPMPTSAIEEAKKIRETVSAKGVSNGNGNGAGHPATVISPPVVTAPVAIAPTSVVTPPAAPAAVVEAPAPAAVVEADPPTEEVADPPMEEVADPPMEEVADPPAEVADPPTETDDAPTATFDAATETPDDSTGSE